MTKFFRHDAENENKERKTREKRGCRRIGGATGEEKEDRAEKNRAAS